MVERNEYFPFVKISEWQCPHCGKYPLNAPWTFDLIQKFIDIRLVYAKPINITSGWRCFPHQKELILKGYKAVIISPHLFGSALDLACDDNERLYKVINNLHPELRIGFEKYDKKIIHIDNAYAIPLYVVDMFIKHNNIDYNLERIKLFWKEGVRW